jgi:V/A-type H+-transporting ATPase subunit G/H
MVFIILKKCRIYSKIIWCDKKFSQGGPSMENAAMQKILEAEAKADKIISDSAKKAREISEKSAQEQKEMTVRFEGKLETEVSAILKSYKDKAIEESRELEISFAKECENIKKEAAPKIDRAIDYVIEKMGDGKWQ